MPDSRCGPKRDDLTRNIKLQIQFDGTDFCGWQMQAEDRTVQGVLTAALKELTGQDLRLYSSSRTDAGVHAVEMVVNFKIETTIPLIAFHYGLNGILPPDLQVTGAEEAPDRFNSRFSAIGKTYVYRIQTGDTRKPLESRRAWHVRGSLDVPAMTKAAAMMLGRHNFNAFRSAQCDSDNPIRTVDELTVHVDDEGIINITIRARGFLRNMVRIVAGTLVEVGRGRKQPEWILELLESGDRTKGGMTAPPQGLFLVKVHYPEEAMLWPRDDETQPA
jgi:tRNA pseudouridine38-40 synthase